MATRKVNLNALFDAYAKCHSILSLLHGDDAYGSSKACPCILEHPPQTSTSSSLMKEDLNALGRSDHHIVIVDPFASPFREIHVKSLDVLKPSALVKMLSYRRRFQITREGLCFVCDVCSPIAEADFPHLCVDGMGAFPALFKPRSRRCQTKLMAINASVDPYSNVASHP